MVRRLRKNLKLVVSSAVLIAFVLVAMFPALIASHSPNEQQIRRRLEPPSAEHLLGTDDLGRDVFSRLVYGTRASLVVAGGAVLIGTMGGLAMGLIGGYFKRSGAFVMRLVDLMLCFPTIVMAIFIVGLVGSGLFNLIVVIGILFIPRMARVVQSVVLTVREQDYVTAQVALGASTARILLTGVLPNVIAPVIVQATLMLATAILTESGLAFLGLGVPPPTASWGGMIGRARDFMMLHPSGVIFPSLTLMMLVLAFNFFGDALRDLVDPQVRRSVG